MQIRRCLEFSWTYPQYTYAMWDVSVLWERRWSGICLEYRLRYILSWIVLLVTVRRQSEDNPILPNICDLLLHLPDTDTLVVLRSLMLFLKWLIRASYLFCSVRIISVQRLESQCGIVIPWSKRWMHLLLQVIWSTHTCVLDIAIPSLMLPFIRVITWLPFVRMEIVIW